MDKISKRNSFIPPYPKTQHWSKYENRNDFYYKKNSFF